MFFSERIFSKEHPIGFRGSVIIDKHILSSEPPEVAITGAQKYFKWWRDTFYWNLRKYLGLVSF